MKSSSATIDQQQQTINRFFDILAAVVFFLIAIGLMSYIQFNSLNPYLSEYDSYYHVKMAELIRDHGIPQTFPWLQYTILRDNFVDHQLLFHILLIPFVSLFGPIVGAKIFEILVVALAFLFFYLILKEHKLPGAIWMALFALFTMSSDFYYRMNFIRDMGLSLLFMTAGMYAIFKNKNWIIGVLSFLYVWAYGGFMFLPIFAITYGVAQLMMGEKINWRLPAFAVGGMLAGLIINPYFPKNLNFLYHQIFETGLGAEQYTGGEWRPYDTWFWVQINIVPIIVFFGSIVVSFLKNIRQSAKTVAIFVFSLLFLVLVWKSKRFVEYAPFFMTFAGLMLLKPLWDEKIKEWQTGEILRKVENIFFVGALVVLLPISISFARGEIQRAYNDTQTLFSMSALTKAHNYLLQNAQEGDIVFTDDWDVFPRYFFANSKTYYLVGLDPEFMNQYDGWPYVGQKGRLYQEFAQISSGNDGTDLERIKNDFKAKWVIVNTDHPEFYQNLKKQPQLFEEVLFATNDPRKDDYPSARGDGYYLFKVL